MGSMYSVCMLLQPFQLCELKRVCVMQFPSHRRGTLDTLVQCITGVKKKVRTKQKEKKNKKKKAETDANTRRSKYVQVKGWNNMHSEQWKKINVKNDRSSRDKTSQLKIQNCILLWRLHA